MIATHMFSEWWLNLALDAVVIALAMALDRILPEPLARIHPVVWMGRATSLLVRRRPGAPLAAFVYGAVVVVLVVGASGAVTWSAIAGLAALGPIAYLLGGALLLRGGGKAQGRHVAASL